MNTSNNSSVNVPTNKTNNIPDVTEIFKKDHLQHLYNIRKRIHRHLMRSLIYDKDHEKDLVINLSLLQRFPLKIRGENEKSIFDYIAIFFVTTSGFPSVQMIKADFSNSDEKSLILEEASSTHCFFCKHEEFEVQLLKLQSNYMNEDFISATFEAYTDYGHGKGAKSMIKIIDSLTAKLSKISSIPEGGGQSGDIRNDTHDVRMEYLDRKYNPSSSVGILTKLEPLDMATRGVQKGELMVVCAPAGGYKTTFVINMAHDAFIRGYNVAFFSLEMPYEQVRRMFYVKHSSSELFKGEGHPIEYDKIKYGTLSPEEEDFYLNRVIVDFKENHKYGKLFVKKFCTGLPTLDMIKMETKSYNTEAPIDILFIDYLALVEPSEGKNFKNRTENVNQIIQDLKQFAINFDHGRSIPIVSPAQINRQGMIKAAKNDGVYDFSCIAEFNHIEKSSDLVIGLYTTPIMKRRNEAKVTVMKSRDSIIPEPFLCYANPATKEIESLPTLDYADYADMDLISLDW